jgi:hypothetical protein
MRYWPFNIRTNLLLSRKDFGKIVGIKQWRLLEIERGDTICSEELAQIINALKELAFYKFEPKVRVSMVDNKHSDQELEQTVRDRA